MADLRRLAAEVWATLSDEERALYPSIGMLAAPEPTVLSDEDELRLREMMLKDAHAAEERMGELWGSSPIES